MSITEQETPALDQARALEERVRRALANEERAYKALDAVVHIDLGLRRRIGEQDETIRELRRANEAKDLEIERHRAAAAARAAVEAAADAKPTRRPLTPREQALATVACLAAFAALCGLAVDAVALLLGGLVTLGVSAAALAVCRTAADPQRPFDLDPDAPKRTAVHDA